IAGLNDYSERIRIAKATNGSFKYSLEFIQPSMAEKQKVFFCQNHYSKQSFATACGSFVGCSIIGSVGLLLMI
ncbi:MAG: hypothetical protein EZS28_032742, partial [Streblomastix strix]